MSPLVLLVVDDHEDNRHIVQTILEHAGHTVITAVDGADGFEQARWCNPDLILMDIMMPVLDGRGATRALKAAAETRHIPVLAMSAHVGVYDTSLLKEDGFCGYLPKPVLPRQVLEAVEACMKGIRAGERWVELAQSM